jgi:hypothetical protein
MKLHDCVMLEACNIMLGEFLTNFSKSDACVDETDEFAKVTPARVRVSARYSCTRTYEVQQQHAAMMHGAVIQQAVGAAVRHIVRALTAAAKYLYGEYIVILRSLAINYSLSRRIGLYAKPKADVYCIRAVVWRAAI